MILPKFFFQNIELKLNSNAWMTLESSVVIFQALKPLQPPWPQWPQQPQWPQWPQQPSEPFRILRFNMRHPVHDKTWTGGKFAWKSASREVKKLKNNKPPCSFIRYLRVYFYWNGWSDKKQMIIFRCQLSCVRATHKIHHLKCHVCNANRFRIVMLLMSIDGVNKIPYCE